ncbi:apses-domain-containing protein, partial [Aureobasidium melanogenum]
MAHHTNRTPQDQGHYSMPYGSQTAQYAVAQSPGMAHTFKALQDAGYGQGASAPTPQQNMRPIFEKPTIYTAVYSGVQVYEMEVNNIACMRRRSDGWLNATQILKVAGVDKGKRTKVLEKEILPGEHEKVQGGYGKYQGTWITYRRGREFCRQYGVEDLLLPLLEHDLDGSGAGQTTETPTKEQAMAANRKRFYAAGAQDRSGPATSNTFFQNISSMSSVALAALNKAARLNSPARPNHIRRSSQQQQNSSHSIMADASYQIPDSGYNTQSAAWRTTPGGQEPPRKRMRPNDDIPVDASIMSLDPTEPGESFLQSTQQYLEENVNGSDEPVTLPPLPTPMGIDEENKRLLLLDLFAESSRQDFASHPALLSLSPQDLDIPLDPSANTALHWAATLSRVPLLRLLIQKGANIFRGNAAGQSALISAVLVNNCCEHSSFPDVLELLSPLIEVRDAQARTILHHIAVSCGIKGRAPSSKYYLEALLEFLVRSVSKPAPVENGSATPGQAGKERMNLMRFLTHIVNARDKAGNTALNLAARIGNRGIIQQLLEVKADPTIPNQKGITARDFGVGVEDENGQANAGFNNPSNIDPIFSQSQAPNRPPSQNATTEGANEKETTPVSNTNVIEEQNQDVISSLTSMLTANLAQHKQLLAEKTTQIDKLNAQIQELSAVAKTESDQLATLQRRAKSRSEAQSKIANLKRILEERHRNGRKVTKTNTVVGDADKSVSPVLAIVDQLPSNVTDPAQAVQQLSPPLQQQILNNAPSVAELRALKTIYETNNDRLHQKSTQLKSRSSQLEHLYRKVVSLCTGVAEDKVEDQLGALLAAVESEKGALGREEAGRVREFLIKVEGVGGGSEVVAAV